MKYTNTSKTANASVFVEVEPTVGNNQVEFKSDQVTPNVRGTVIPMVRASVRLVRKNGYKPCDTDCSVEVNESFRMEFNILKGSDLSVLRGECVRVMDEAIAKYYLAQGFVPPVDADFNNA